ncbi:hypothetical protein EYF80_011883 [Liparis tanakae]|uniref:Uncharacterized protein n=1 Tax=Liparis tanakae TaxID=230148 RepID=A0A4Z2IIQ1_9TELE|nr:hypothetical protein EYF80_011883 [Liparis tanakae]
MMRVSSPGSPSTPSTNRGVLRSASLRSNSTLTCLHVFPASEATNTLTLLEVSSEPMEPGEATLSRGAAHWETLSGASEQPAIALNAEVTVHPAVSLLRTPPTVTPPSRRASWGSSPLIIFTWLKYPGPALAHLEPVGGHSLVHHLPPSPELHRAVELQEEQAGQNPVFLFGVEKQAEDVEAQPVLLVGGSFIGADQETALHLRIRQQHYLKTTPKPSVLHVVSRRRLVMPIALRPLCHHTSVGKRTACTVNILSLAAYSKVVLVSNAALEPRQLCLITASGGSSSCYVGGRPNLYREPIPLQPFNQSQKPERHGSQKENSGHLVVVTAWGLQLLAF